MLHTRRILKCYTDTNILGTGVLKMHTFSIMLCQNRMYLWLSVINNNKICMVYFGTEVWFALHILLFMIVPGFMCTLGIGQQRQWLRW